LSDKKVKEEIKEEDMQEMIILKNNNTSIQQEITRQQNHFVKMIYKQIIGQQNQFEMKLKMEKKKIKNMEYIRHKNRIIKQQMFKQRNKIREMKKTITELEKNLHMHHTSTESNKNTRKLETKTENKRPIIISNERQDVKFELKSYDIENQLQEIISEFLGKERFILDICLKHKEQDDQKVSYKSLQYTEYILQSIYSL